MMHLKCTGLKALLDLQEPELTCLILKKLIIGNYRATFVIKLQYRYYYIYIYILSSSIFQLN